jgi:hypothetical protein
VRVRPRDVPAPCTVGGARRAGPRHPPTGAGVSLTCHGMGVAHGPSPGPGPSAPSRCSRARARVGVRGGHGDGQASRPGPGARLAGASAQPPTGPVPRWQRHQEGAGSIHDLIRFPPSSRQTKSLRPQRPKRPSRTAAVPGAHARGNYLRDTTAFFASAEWYSGSRKDEFTHGSRDDSTSRAAEFGANPI